MSFQEYQDSPWKTGCLNRRAWADPQEWLCASPPSCRNPETLGDPPVIFLPPFPSLPLDAALWATNILAILMCAQGWLVPKLSWITIGWVVTYTVVWVFVMDIIK
ncbi:MAG: hypothetical protein RKR03_05885 [Candidatus Competibacter sp.]|nr:hypothetical protein [Candidatus Competibacter sp.]MDS4069174.1 hypothetical protein [Candidatus Competibacter sp.]